MKLNLFPRVLSQMSPGPSGVNDSRRGFLLKAGVGLGAGVVSGPALALSEGILKEVASFLKAHPEMKDEFMPAEQDCLDGKRKVDTCEAEIRRALADMKKEVAVNRDKAQLNADKAQLNADKAQLNADKAQLNARKQEVEVEAEMSNRLTLASVIGEMNNRIQYGKGGRTGVASLVRITNPIFAQDIAFISQIDQKLLNGEKIGKPDIQSLQSMLVLHSGKALAIYNSFSPKQQKEFLDMKTVAIESKNLIIR